MRFLCYPILALLVAGAAPALAQQAAQAVNRTVKPNKETLVITHANSFKPGRGMQNCDSGSIPTIKIVSPPKHGDVSIRPATEKNSNCTNPVNAAGIYYTPNSGFVGDDAFSYNRTEEGIRADQMADNPSGVRNVTIHVKP